MAVAYKETISNGGHLGRVPLAGTKKLVNNAG